MGEVVSMSHHKTTTDATITDIWCLCRYITVPPSKLPKRFWRVWEKEIQTVKSRQRLLTLQIMFSSNEKYQWCLLGYKGSNISKSQHYTICSSKPKSTLYPISSGKIPSATFLSPFESPESIANVRLLWGLKVQNNDANLIKKTAYSIASTQYPFLIFFFYARPAGTCEKNMLLPMCPNI